MKRFFIFLVAAIASLSLSAQNPMMQPLPNDPAVKVGKLDNGLTYYIRKNALPEHRAEFYLATKAGGEFFGQTGSFEQGWAADFLITDVPSYQQERTVDEQLQYFIYHGTAQDIREVYVNGLAVKK